MNIFAKFDENPAITLQVIKKTKRYGRTEAQTDNVKTVYPTTNKVCGGYNNNRCFVIGNCKTAQLKQSFLVRTEVEWNHLDTVVVRADSVESFRETLTRCY